MNSSHGPIVRKASNRKRRTSQISTVARCEGRMENQDMFHKVIQKLEALCHSVGSSSEQVVWAGSNTSEIAIESRVLAFPGRNVELI